MIKRYILRPGWIFSRNDGDRHYISAPQLAQLYGVSMQECFIARDETSLTDTALIALEPRYDGNYEIPTT